MKINKITIKIGLAFASVIFLASLESATAQGTFVINGTFDARTFDAGTTGWTFSGSGKGGWEVSAGNPGGCIVISGRPISGIPSPETVSQTIYGLTPGVSYTVSGDYEALVDIAGDELAVTIDGTSKYFAGSRFDWRSFSFTFTADTDSTVLSLSSGNSVIDNDYRIDNIAITVVPEPSPQCLVGLGGIAGLLFLRRKAALARC
jgi:hypothetical protein